MGNCSAIRMDHFYHILRKKRFDEQDHVNLLGLHVWNCCSRQCCVQGARALLSKLQKQHIYVARMQALKGTRAVDRYALYWSPRPEFIRIAARLGAQIIPFGAIGCEENATAIMNANNFKTLGKTLSALQGHRVAQQDTSNERLRARRGVNDLGADNELDSVRSSSPCPHSWVYHTIRVAASEAMVQYLGPCSSMTHIRPAMTCG
jgi:hypothetical protein